MPANLTPEQIAKLGEHVIKALEDNPPRPAHHSTIQDWERALEYYVDHDTDLPSYRCVQRDHTKVLAFLITYYGP